MRCPKCEGCMSQWGDCPMCKKKGHNMDQDLKARVESLETELRESEENWEKMYVASQKRVAELEAMMQWQSMETAPRDGTPILVTIPGYKAPDAITTARWCEWSDSWQLIIWQDSYCSPTHWCSYRIHHKLTKKEG